METPLWSNLHLDDTVTQDVSEATNQVVLWVRGALAGAYQNWERLSSTAGEPIRQQGSLQFVRVAADAARQKVRNLFGKTIAPPHQATSDGDWQLPDGTFAERVDDSVGDRTLVWSAADSVPLEVVERDFAAHGAIVRLGANAFLIVPETDNSGLAHNENGKLNPTTQDKSDCAQIRDQASRALRAARAAGNRQHEATALIDMGIVSLRAGDLQQSVDFLREALGLAETLYDRELTSDALVNFGLALLATGQIERAEEVLRQEITEAQACGQVHRAKLAMDHLGAVHVKRGDIRGALARYQEALTLAEQAEDRQHQADLCWIMAVQHAELGERDQAVTKARQALALYTELGDPSASDLNDALQEFVATVDGEMAPKSEGPTSPGGNEFTFGNVASSQSNSMASGLLAQHGPRMLWQAFSAAKSLARFVGTGLKTVDATIHQQRLSACAICPQHTGVRCRVCSCFTSIKAWLPHEKCPLGSWPR